jgi:CubicO group peptidase (beta-lactamase class C family)
LTDSEEIRRQVGIDTAKLDEAYELIQQETKHGGLLVVRHGWLVYEKYFGAGHRDATPNLASCGKSFTSVAVGILLAERPELFPDGLDQKIFTPKYLPAEAFPLTDPRKADIRLGQLLSMTAGVRGNNPCYVRGKQQTITPPGPDGAPAMADDVALGLKEITYQGQPTSTRTLWCAPGEGYSYATSSIHLASVMLRHTSGVEMEQFLQTRLAEPLGWGEWGFGYRGSKLAHTPGGGGITLRSTDMLRFLYLLLREGRWNERQLIPAEYVRHCSQRSPYNPHFPYSLQFNVNTGGEIAELPRDAWWKTGSGGHVFYIVPSLDLVAWKIGGRDGQYSPNDTGRALPPEARKTAESRADWKQTVDKETAVKKTLQLIVQSIAE